MKKWKKTLVASLFSIIPSSLNKLDNSIAHEKLEDPISPPEHVAQKEPDIPTAPLPQTSLKNIDLLLQKSTKRSISCKLVDIESEYWFSKKDREKNLAFRKDNVDKTQLALGCVISLSPKPEKKELDLTISYKDTNFFMQDSTLSPIDPKDKPTVGNENWSLPQKSDIFCSTVNTNDDKWGAKLGEEASLSVDKDGQKYVDGGRTQGFSGGCQTEIWSFALTHDMFTNSTLMVTPDYGYEIEGERPAGGQFSLKLGKKDNIFSSSKIDVSSYLQGDIGYSEIKWTQRIQNEVHRITNWPERNYKTAPIKEGLDAELSYGLSSKLKLGTKFPSSTSIFGGATYGTGYWGGVAGARFELGNHRDSLIDFGIRFKTDTLALPYINTGRARVGDWNVSFEVGQFTVGEDSRFGSIGFREKTGYNSLTFTKQLTDSITGFSSTTISQNTAEKGPSQVGQFRFGIVINLDKPSGRGR